MRRRLFAAGLAAALLVGAAGAQTLGTPKPAPPPRIFLSPSGEPFRLPRPSRRVATAPDVA